MLAFALVRDGVSAEADEIVPVVLGLAAASAPPVVLLVFLLSLHELIGLPERIRALPGTGRERAAELAHLAAEARAQAGRRSRRLPLLLWRFSRLVGASRELLTPWAPLMPLLSVPFLALTAAAAAAAVLEIAVALAVLAVLLA